MRGEILPEGPYGDLEEAKLHKEIQSSVRLKGEGQEGKLTFFFFSPSLCAGNHVKLSVISWIHPTSPQISTLTPSCPCNNWSWAGLGQSRMPWWEQMGWSGLCTRHHSSTTSDPLLFPPLPQGPVLHQDKPALMWCRWMTFPLGLELDISHLAQTSPWSGCPTCAPWT